MRHHLPAIAPAFPGALAAQTCPEGTEIPDPGAGGTKVRLHVLDGLAAALAAPALVIRRRWRARLGSMVCSRRGQKGLSERVVTTRAPTRETGGEQTATGPGLVATAVSVLPLMAATALHGDHGVHRYGDQRGGGAGAGW